jgi:hypothetical protein
MYLSDVWSYKDALENGFTITEILASGAADVYYKGKYVGEFTICKGRESRENPNRLLRWISDVPFSNGSSIQKRIQINLNPITLPQ